MHRLHTFAFRDERLPLFQAPFNPRIIAHLDVPLLEQIIKQCEHPQFLVVFRPLYSIVFFSFLRVSNVLPHFTAKFDHTRQLVHRDMVFGEKVFYR